MSELQATGTKQTDKKNLPWHKRLTKEWVIPILSVLAVLLPLRSVVADWYDVPTGSMEPTILPGDRIVANKLAFGLRVPFTEIWVARWDRPVSGEIVILHSPANGQRLVKRVIATEGDTVEMRNNHLVINGAALAYDPFTSAELDSIEKALRNGREFATESLGAVDHTVMVTPRAMAKRSFGPVTVPAGNCFVMGDNRDASADSRAFGFVPLDKVVGRSSRVAFSLDPQRWPLPRMDRFLHGLE